MFFSQMEHLIKMTNNLLSNVTWSVTLHIYLLLLTHLFTKLIICLTITHPLNYLLFTYLSTYLLIPFHLHTTYLLTCLTIYMLPIGKCGLNSYRTIPPYCNNITNLQVSWVHSKSVRNLLFHRFVLFTHKCHALFKDRSCVHDFRM